ncbi:hypothetical protein D9M68_713150 [compost metagenome]
MSQDEAHAVFVELVDAFDQLRHGHGLGIGEAAHGQFVPRVLRIELALETPQHIVGVEVAARGEPGGAVKLYALAQIQGVVQAIGGYLPAFGQAWNQRGTARGEIHQALEQGLRRGVGGGGGGVLDDVEAFRTRLGADHKVVGCGVCMAGGGKRATQ